MRSGAHSKTFRAQRQLHRAREPRGGSRDIEKVASMSDQKRVPPRMPSTDELLAVLRRVLEGVRPRGINVAVVGGLAMQLRGSPRLTKDIDVLADAPPPTDLQLSYERSLSFGGQTLATPEGIPLDWILRDDDYRDLYREALECPVLVEAWIPVVRVAYLAVMKFATLRARDYEDLMFLLPRLEPDEIEEAMRIVHARLGGKFASDQFAAAIDEARWRAETDGE